MVMKLSDTDNIVLDLEDTTNDINSLQTILISNFHSSEYTDDNLYTELDLLLADDQSSHELLRRPEKKEHPPSKKAESVKDEKPSEAVQLEVMVPELEQATEDLASNVTESSTDKEMMLFIGT
jgi:hypothetical protein